MKKLLTGLMAVVMMAGLAGCGSKDDGAGEGSDTAKKELTVYTNSGYKPYEMVDEKGNLYGFDIDVMNEAAKLAGYTVKWEDVDFDGIVPSVKQGKADIGIAGITYTEERAKQVDFSDVYYAGEDAQNYVLTMKSLSLIHISLQYLPNLVPYYIWFGCKEKGVYEFAIRATHTEDI